MTCPGAGMHAAEEFYFPSKVEALEDAKHMCNMLHEWQFT